MSKFRLSVLYDDNKVYAEFSPEDFKRVLIEEYSKVGDVDEAFERTVTLLKKKLLSM